MTVIPFPTKRPASGPTPLIMIAFPEDSTEGERERTVAIMRTVFKDDLEFLVAHGGTRMFAVPVGGDVGNGGRIIPRQMPTKTQMDDVESVLRDIVLQQTPTTH